VTRPAAPPVARAAAVRRTPLLLRATIASAVLLAVGASLARMHVAADQPVLAEPTMAGSAPAAASISPVAQALSRGTSDVLVSRSAARVSCQVDYQVISRTQNRFSVVVTITNTGVRPIDGWTLRWRTATSPRVTNGWNATVVNDPTGVRASGVGQSRTISAGGSTTIGFVGSGGMDTPTRFSLNGAICR
jgi:hypothetical protein